MDNSSISAGLVTPAAARVIPFALFIAFIVLQTLAGDWMHASGLDTRWLYAARTIVVALVLFVFWSRYTEIQSFSGITSRRLLIALAAGVAVFFLWVNLDYDWATVGQARAFDPTLSDGSGLDWRFVVFRVIGLALVVPVMEELFWRSFLLRWIDRHDFLAQDPGKVSIRAILICALLFASEHNLWFAGLLAGLVYNLVYVRTGNLWLPIISHATTNAALALWIMATGNWRFW